MPIEEGIWRIDNSDVRRVNAAPLEAERRLEDVLVKEISILGLGPLLILDRQVRTEFGGYIDILALDGEGVLHVIELKKGQTPREIVAQALDYGSWVSLSAPNASRKLSRTADSRTVDRYSKRSRSSSAAICPKPSTRAIS